MTDGQEEIRITHCEELFVVPGVEEDAGGHDDNGVLRLLSATESDSDNDGAADGFEVDPPEDSVVVSNSGPDPENPDVVQVLIALDEEYVEKFGFRSKEHIMEQFERVNRHFYDNFEDRDGGTPQFVPVDSSEWLQWQRSDEHWPGNESEANCMGNLREDLKATTDRAFWPEISRGADIVVGYSGHNIGRPETMEALNELAAGEASLDDAAREVFSDFGDGCIHNEEPVVSIATDDPVTNLVPGLRDNLLQHELGHVFGASHNDGTPGNMCKYDCMANLDASDPVLVTFGTAPLAIYYMHTKTANMWTTHEFSEVSKEEMVKRIKVSDSYTYEQSIKEISTRGG